MQLDDVPAVSLAAGSGGMFGGAGAMDEYPPEVEDFTTLSLDELLRHGNWKARKEGLEAIAANPTQGSQSLLAQLPRLAKEGNTAAQEALFDAALAVLTPPTSSEPDNSAQIADALVKLIIEKGIVGRPKAQQSSNALLTGLVECAQHATVVSNIIAGFSHKTPRNRIACAQLCTLILSEFGPVPFQLKSLLKSLVPLFNDPNPMVRKEAQNLCAQCYKYVGQGITAFLSDLRDVQLQELTKIFEEIVPGSCVPSRFVKGMSAPAAASSKSLKGISALGVNGGDGGSTDVFDLVDESPVLSKLPKSFFAVALDKSLKWQDRAAMIKDTLQPLLAVPKIRQADDYTELVKLLRELLLDPQFPLVLIGIKCVQDLAKSLRAPLVQYVRHLIPALFDKFKDKKASLLDAIHITVDGLLAYRCVSLEMLQDEIELGATSKIPNQRHAIVLWLQHVLENGVEPSSLSRIAKSHATLLKLVNDEKGEIRESTLQLIGKLHAVLGERALVPVLQGLDDKQRAKTGIAVGGGGGGIPMTLGADVSPTHRPGAPLLSQNKIVLGVSSSASSGSLKKASSNAAASSLAAPRSSDPQKSGKLPSGTVSSPASAASGDDAVTLEAGLPQKDDALAKITNVLGVEGDGILPFLGAKEWKSRADAATKLGQVIQSAWDAATADAHIESLIVLLKHSPGWKESIFQVFNAMCYAVIEAAKLANTVTTRAAFSLIVNVTPRITDVKNKQCVRELLSSLMIFVGPKFVMKQCLNIITAAKTPKLTQEVLEYFVRSLYEFPEAPIDTKALVDFAKSTCFDQAVPMVRQAGIVLVAALRHRFGSKIDNLLVDINAHVKASLESEIDRFAPPTDVVVREVRASSGVSASAANRGGMVTSSGLSLAASTGPSAAPVAEDIPRVDVAVYLIALGKEVSNGKDWKARQQAVKKVEELLLNANKNIHANGVTDMLKALRTRFDDPNKNVVVDALKTITLLIESAGSQACRPGLKAILPAVFSLLADQKQSLRDEAYAVAQLGAMSLGMENILPMVIKPLSSESQMCRQLTIEVVEKGFAANTVPLKASFLLPVVVPLVRLLMDRTVEVRSIADKLVAIVMPFVGPDAFQKAAMDLKPAEQQQVRPSLERHFAAVIGYGLHAGPSVPAVTAPAPPRESIVLGAAGGSIAPLGLLPRATITLGPNSQTGLPQPSTATSKMPAASVLPQQGGISAQTKVAALADNDVPLSVEEICLGLRSASSAGALRMCGDFMKRFRRGEDCGTLDVMTTMIERLYQNIQALEADLALGLIGCLNVMFESTRSASRCNSDKLYPMFGMVFDCLLSEQFSTNDSVIKALNNMALRMLVGCPIDDVFSALMSRLDTYSTKYLETATKMDHKYLQVVVKCLMRLEAENVRTENIILACHDYLLQHPPSAFRTRDDLPIRTIKTILQNIAKQHGRELLDLADKFVGSQNLVSHFIRACLESKEREMRRAEQPQAAAGEGRTSPAPAAEGIAADTVRRQQHIDPAAVAGAPGAGVQGVSSQPPSLSSVAPNVHASRPVDDGKPVAQIFSKIRSHATSAAGCEELYEYLKQNPSCPEFVLQLNRCSDAFRSYIKRRLERAAHEDTQRPDNFTFPAVLQTIA